jgi:hypothetical protein
LLFLYSPFGLLLLVYAQETRKSSQVFGFCAVLRPKVTVSSKVLILTNHDPAIIRTLFSARNAVFLNQMTLRTFVFVDLWSRKNSSADSCEQKGKN